MEKVEIRQGTRRNIHYLQKESNEKKNISKQSDMIEKKIEKKEIHGNLGWNTNASVDFNF